MQFNINPEELTDQEWTQRFQEWVYVNKLKESAQEAMLEKTMRKVLFEVVNAVFKAMNREK